MFQWMNNFFCGNNFTGRNFEMSMNARMAASGLLWRSEQRGFFGGDEPAAGEVWRAWQSRSPSAAMVGGGWASGKWGAGRFRANPVDVEWEESRSAVFLGEKRP
jgi:hypothetical protein